MPNWFRLPPRPRYEREWLIAGYPTLALFLLLFLVRLLLPYASFYSNHLLFQLLVEAAVFLLPALLFVRYRGKGYTRALRIRLPFAMHIPFMICTFFALFSGALLLSVLCGGIETLGNSAAIFEEAAPANVWQGIGMALVLAIVPALLEEFFFRGILMAEYERRGFVRALFMTSLLFSLLHFDIANLPVYLYSGLLLGLLLFATDSLPAVMTLHVLYNLFSLFGQRYINAFYRFTGSVELFLFLLIVILLVSLLFLCREGARLYQLRATKQGTPPRRDVPANVQLYTLADALCDPPILIVLVISVVGFIVL